MTIKSFYVRNMLLNYDKQLVTARRLARYRRSVSRAGPEDEPPIPREVKRGQLVERVSQEVVENLLMNSGDNVIVTQIRQQLEEEFSERFFFEFPLTDEELRILKDTPDGPVELEGNDKMRVLNRLWKITLDKVNGTML